MDYLTEKVFEYRNKAYGSYELQKIYGKNTRLAVIIVLSVLLFAWAIPAVLSLIPEKEVEFEKKKDVEAVLEEVPIDEEEKKELPEEINEPPPPPPQKSQMQYIEPEIKKDEDIKEPEKATIQSIDTLKKSDAVVSSADVKVENESEGIALPSEFYGDGKADAKPAEVKPAEAPEKEPGVDEFTLVQQEPQPVNLDDIKRNLKYPEVAKQAQIQGKVMVRILVNKEGVPIKHVVKRSPHDLLTKSCVDEIYKLRFKPAINAGKPVVCWVSIPFDFKLK
jgi:periplasmic protein TonB